MDVDELIVAVFSLFGLLQVHKQGNKFEYYSRSLKTVQPHKVRCDLAAVLKTKENAT